MLAILVLIVLTVFTIIMYTLPAYIKLRKSGIRTIRGQVSTIEDAVKYLRHTKLAGWGLVTEAQRLVAEKMEYSRRNNWDSPKRAFARGMGYCQQQAEALLTILRELGFDARLVQCTKNMFPPKKIHEYQSPGGMCGHVWLRVRINGEEKDVCPGNIHNEPGVIHFKVLGKVKDYSGLIKILGHLASALMNTVWDKKASKTIRS